MALLEELRKVLELWSFMNNCLAFPGINLKDGN